MLEMTGASSVIYYPVVSCNLSFQGMIPRGWKHQALQENDHISTTGCFKPRSHQDFWCETAIICQVSAALEELLDCAGGGQGVSSRGTGDHRVFDKVPGHWVLSPKIYIDRVWEWELIRKASSWQKNNDKQIHFGTCHRCSFSTGNLQLLWFTTASKFTSPQMLVMFNPWHPLLGVPQTDLNFDILATKTWWNHHFRWGHSRNFAVCGGPPESLRATSGGAGAASCVHQDRVASDFRA